MLAEKAFPPKAMFFNIPRGAIRLRMERMMTMSTLLEKVPVISEKPWIHVRAMLAAKVWMGQAFLSITWNPVAMNGRQYLGANN